MDKALLGQLKASLGCNLFSSEINGITYVYRPLRIAEFDTITKAAESDADIEDYIVQNAIVYPQDINFNKMKAGYISALAERIMAISGYTDAGILTSALETARNSSVGDVRFSMKAFVLSVIPAYTEEDLDQLDIYQLIDKVVLAERVAKMQQDIAGIQMEQPPLFYIRALDEDDEYYEEEQEYAPSERKIKEPKLDKKQLLEQMRKAEREASAGSYGVKYEEAFSDFREEELVRISGRPKPNDPIAEQLKRALM